jgi:hypothetical protein
VRHLAFVLVLAIPAAAQLTSQNVASILGFENNTQAGVAPAAWSSSPAGTVFADDQVVHGGQYSARIERSASSPSTYSFVTAGIPIDFSGNVIELRGWFKTENATGPAALWINEVNGSTSVAFASQEGLNISGTRDWTRYSITLPVTPSANQVFFGFLLDRAGKAWVDDLELLVDGVPVSRAPRRGAVIDTDHEFDYGSRISLTSLSDTQVANLATLAKVWGFLKYHHPAITSGTRHWDYDLFRILPQVLAAEDQTSAKQVLNDWIIGLGPVADCSPCASLDTSKLYFKPDLDWISDQSLLGSDLSQTLLNIYRNRSAIPAQFFVSLASNPSFDHEPSYLSTVFPDAGYQLLALFRFWNMIEYFSPNRDIMADDPAAQPNYWNDVLTEFIPAIALAGDKIAYQQQLMRFIVRIHDTHANLWSSLAFRPPTGPCVLPVDLRFVEGKPIVRRYNSPAGDAPGLMPGDLIEQLDGVAVNDLIDQWRPYYADSNDAARFRDIAINMTHGSCGPATVAVRREGSDDLVTVTSTRVPLSTINSSYSYHDWPGDTFRLINSDIAYLKLSSVKAADSASYIQAAAGTKGLIIDLRNYPSEFVVFTLGQLLVSQPTNFVTFTHADLVNPGAIVWWITVFLTPQQPHYDGKVVILVDEITQSQAEYTTMAFRTAPGAIVIGSTTAGADGNISTVPLPGGLSSYISGLGVFYPDGHPTQRIGIIPDIVVKPTIAAIRAGRDELLEEAVRQIQESR